MKNLILLAFLGLSISFSSCDLNKYTQFNMEFVSSVTVPASTGINLPFDLFTPDVTTNAETTFGNNDTNKELIQEIRLTELVLDITAPGDRDFDFLKEIYIYLDAEGLSEIEIASLTDIPMDVDNITLNVNDNDLKEYIKKDKFQLRVKTVTDEFLNQDVTIKTYSKFFVDAEVLGV